MRKDPCFTELHACVILLQEGSSIMPTELSTRLELIRDILLPLWPNPKPLLSYSNCFELLCAVILSAQCTDEQVNAVTPVLFAAYPDPEKMRKATLEDIETIIHSAGFFHTKARHLIQCSAILCEKFEGKVPSSFDELLSLPGVGRKTANLVISACFGVPGVVVDTHVLRVAQRLGLHTGKDPYAVEMKIRGSIPAPDLTAFSHALNRHGKFVCTARNPHCTTSGSTCPLLNLCPRIGIDKA